MCPSHDYHMNMIIEGNPGNKRGYISDTGCSLNIVFSLEDFKIFRTTLAFFCFPSVVSVCVHTTGTGRKPALQQNLQSSEKSQNIKEKHNI